MATRKHNKISLFNVKVWWWNLNRMNEMAGKYTVDIGPLGAKEIEQLKAVGIKLNKDKDDSKTKGERGTYLTLKTKDNAYIRLTDKDNTVLDITTTEVGNGSLCHVQIQPFDWVFKTTSGVGAGPDTIKIINLIAPPKTDPFADAPSDSGAGEDAPF